MINTHHYNPRFLLDIFVRSHLYLAFKTALYNVLVGFSIYSGKDWRPKPSLAEFFLNATSAEQALERYPSSAMSMSEYHRSYSIGHRRLYYRSITCLPAPSVDHVGDSDDENDPDWLKKKTCLMIDEFTDVNEGEKALMKAWNLHVLKHK